MFTSNLSRSDSHAVTFAVDPVDPAEDRLPERATKHALEFSLRCQLEACSDYASRCLEGVGCHPLVYAVTRAYADHRPLAFTPDIMWTTIAQGLSAHIRLEHAADSIVSDKLQIEIDDPGLLNRSPENPWADVLSDFADAIQAQVRGEVRDLFRNDFSTTTPASRAVSDLILLETLGDRFAYGIGVLCGVPEVTVVGAPDDWRRIRAKIDELDYFGLDWWTPALRTIVGEFLAASEERPNPEFWQSMSVGREMECEGDSVSGWIGRLFPYLRDDASKLTRRNPQLNATDGDVEISADAYPTGISSAPFDWRTSTGVARLSMLGGFLGVEQLAGSTCLQPMIGWAVRREPEVLDLGDWSFQVIG